MLNYYTPICLLTLSDFSDAAQVVIAVANLALAFYLFVYQKNKDKKGESDTARLNEQNIKLQWFKELIIQPNLPILNDFYTNLHTLRGRVTRNNLSTEEREKINEFIKSQLMIVRRSFMDVLHLVDKQFGVQVKNNLDTLIDGITEAIFNDDLKLNQESVYEKEIGSKISYSKNSLFAQIYNYKG